jgi:hypothetical protein
MRSLCVVVLALFSVSPQSRAQEFRRLWPVDAANDGAWHTGANTISPDGRFIGGYQNASAMTPSGAIWDMASGSTRPVLTTFDWGIRAMSDDARTFMGHTTASAVRWCRTGSGCLTLSQIATIWACSGDGSIVIGDTSTVGGARPVLLFPQSGASTTATGLGATFDPIISADGSTAYFTVVSGLSSTSFRWAMTQGSQPVSIGSPFPSSVAVALCGVSDDGQTAYFSVTGRMAIYTHGQGFQIVEGMGEVQISSITPDGRRAVGRAGVGNTGGFLWDPFTGLTPLSIFAPELERLASSPQISRDGSCVTGSVRTPSGLANLFWLRLPDTGGLQGDYSLDGNQDQDDVGEYIRYFTGARNPHGLPLDYNRDNIVSIQDLVDLVDCVAGGCP